MAVGAGRSGATRPPREAADPRYCTAGWDRQTRIEEAAAAAAAAAAKAKAAAAAVTGHRPAAARPAVGVELEATVRAIRKQLLASPKYRAAVRRVRLRRGARTRICAL